LSLHAALPIYCDAALRLVPAQADWRTPRGLAYLRMGRANPALADFSAALRADPKDARALYGRGLAERGKSRRKIRAAEDDIAAALALNSAVAGTFARYGIK